jgi:NAD(P)-dependent dehydrogenase (short-subunit alcohol dehydrogenase family)
MKLANKVALITGAGSGMGKSAALIFAVEGAKVAAVDVAEAQARRLSPKSRRGAATPSRFAPMSRRARTSSA